MYCVRRVLHRLQRLTICSLVFAVRGAYILRCKVQGPHTTALWEGHDMSTHYIGMARLHGCLPQRCDVYDTRRSAAEGLAQVHELGRERTARLERMGYLE